MQDNSLLLWYFVNRLFVMGSTYLMLLMSTRICTDAFSKRTLIGAIVIGALMIQALRKKIKRMSFISIRVQLAASIAKGSNRHFLQSKFEIYP